MRVVHDKHDGLYAAIVTRVVRLLGQKVTIYSIELSPLEFEELRDAGYLDHAEDRLYIDVADMFIPIKVIE